MLLGGRMTHRTEKRTTGVRLVLRAVGVAFASALMFLVLAVLNGGGTAAAATSRPGSAICWVASVRSDRC